LADPNARPEVRSCIENWSAPQRYAFGFHDQAQADSQPAIALSPRSQATPIF
jgi:hypothetical protein